MSDLIVVGFKGEDTIEWVLNKLTALSQESVIDLDDGSVVGGDHHRNMH
jgi:uncharacterized membrane protein